MNKPDISDGIPEKGDFDAKKGRLLPIIEYGYLLGVSKGRIAQIVADETFPETIPGKNGARLIWSSDFIRWYAKREANIAVEKLIPEGEDLSQRPLEELRLIKARREKVNVEKKKMAGDLVPIAEVREHLDMVAVLLCSSLEAVSGRLANDIASVTNPAEASEVLLQEMRTIRRNVSGKCAKFEVAS